MALFKAKQVKKFIAGKLFLGAIPVTFVGGSPSLFTSVSIATKLTTALTAAAADGSNLPDQSDTFVSGLTTKRREGLPYTAPSNLVEVYNAFYQKMKDTVGNEVYGRLTAVPLGYTTPYEDGYVYAAGEIEAANVAALAAVGAPTTVPEYITTLNGLVTTEETNFPLPRTEYQAAVIHYMEKVALEVQTYADANAGGTLAGAVQTARDYATTYATIVPAAAHTRVTFYTRIMGVETLYNMSADTFGSGIGLNLVVPYTYSFNNLPFDFASGIKGTFISDDPSSTGNTVIEEELTYNAVNDFTPLTYGVKASTVVYVSVNGITFNSNQVTVFAITPVTNVLDWKTTAPYVLEDEDRVVVKYVSNGVATV